jgi:hypothetical protein
MRISEVSELASSQSVSPGARSNPRRDGHSRCNSVSMLMANRILNRSALWTVAVISATDSLVSLRERGRLVRKNCPRSPLRDVRDTPEGLAGGIL